MAIFLHITFAICNSEIRCTSRVGSTCPVNHQSRLNSLWIELLIVKKEFIKHVNLLLNCVEEKLQRQDRSKSISRW